MSIVIEGTSGLAGRQGILTHLYPAANCSLTALIILENSDRINIKSNYGKYNSDNYDTIFSKNVIINYLENEIFSEYLDFSMARNSMIISRNVVFTNLDNVLKADVVEINIKTKDTKIFMYEKERKVNIKSIN